MRKLTRTETYFWFLIVTVQGDIFNPLAFKLSTPLKNVLRRLSLAFLNENVINYGTRKIRFNMLKDQKLLNQMARIIIG